MPKGVKHGDLSGTSIGSLTMQHKMPDDASSLPHRPVWLCLCQCGQTLKRRQDYLLSDRSKNACCSSCKKGKHRTGKNSPLWLGVGDLSGQYFASLKAGAKNRKIPFDVTIEYLWSLFEEQKGLCALSGLPIQFHQGAVRDNRRGQTASLDRKDPALGYIKGNVWWTHKIANQMRNHFDLEVFLGVCNAVAKVHPCDPDQQKIDLARGTRSTPKLPRA